MLDADKMNKAAFRAALFILSEKLLLVVFGSATEVSVKRLKELLKFKNSFNIRDFVLKPG